VAVSFKELWDSRKGGIGANDASIVLRFIATGTTEEAELYTAIILEAPTFYDGLVRNDIHWQNLGGPSWLVELTFGTKGAGGGDQPVGDCGGVGVGTFIMRRLLNEAAIKRAATAVVVAASAATWPAV